MPTKYEVELDTWVPPRRRGRGDADRRAGSRFELCRKGVEFGEHEFDQFWIDRRTIYPDRGRHAEQFESLVEGYRALCLDQATLGERDVCQSYVLARLLPDVRSGGARKVFDDSVPDRRSRECDDELDGMLRSSREGRTDRGTFRDQTASALGPPDYDRKVWDCYREFEARLLEDAVEVAQSDDHDEFERVIGCWQELMRTIGRRAGKAKEKAVLDILSYESRAALHRCYSAVMAHVLDRLALDGEISSRESARFHRFWHLEEVHAAERENARFHLFHGHVFALHPACANFVRAPSGRELIGQWLSESSEPSFERLLHGIGVAIHDYAVRQDVYRSLRRKQPDSIGGTGDIVAREEQMEEERRRRRGTTGRSDE